jgi:hypothetical protein
MPPVAAELLAKRRRKQEPSTPSMNLETLKE